MIDNTVILAQGPLCATREEALAHPGLLYIHIKAGGVYRKICEAKYAGEKTLRDGRDLEGVRFAVYEHLWPHDHDLYTRPMSEFVEVVRTPKGVHRRFEFATNETLSVH